MADRWPHAANSPATDFAVTHPLRPVTLAALLSLILFSSSAAFSFLALEPITPAARLMPISITTLAFVIVWAGIDIAMIVRRPSPEESVRVWGPLANLIMICAHGLCMWLIWGVLMTMPASTRDNQFMVVAFLVAYVPVQIICSPENTLLIRVGIVTVLGSAVIFLLTRQEQNAQILGAYIFGFGCVMYFLSDNLRHRMHKTVAGRLASDAVAQKLEALLVTVAAERDAKTRFIASASHDLAQPLQAVSLFFDQTLRARTETTRAKAADGVRRALASADQLLSHMLNHLRLEADAVEPFPSRVSISALLARIAAQYAPAAKAAGLDIRWVETRQVLMLDPVLLERALGNLVNNAIQHSGGKRLVLGARAQGDAYVTLWVIDDGAGIGRTDAKHIFDDYYRGVDSREAVKSGFGLGLSSVRRIVTLMGGETGLDPRWMRGAAFYMRFPAIRPPGSKGGTTATRDARRFFSENLPHL